MDLWQHAVISGAASGAIWLGTGDVPAALAFSVSGVLVDCDHLPDYWREKGFNLDLPAFFAHFDKGRPVKLWLAGHAWEWAALGFGVCAFTQGPSWGWALSAGLLLHLVLDQFANNFRPFGYSLLYRIAVGFDAERIFYPAKAPHG